jgi:uncharacterized protein YycO
MTALPTRLKIKMGSLEQTRHGENMADHLNKNAVSALPITDYPILRASLRTGDLLFASGDYLVSRAIQKVTKSPWSHVGIIFKIEEIDRVLLLESVEDMGVRFVPLSKYTKDYEKEAPYDGRLVVARINDFIPSEIEPIAKFGIDELTRPYDKDEVSKIIARVVLKIGKIERDREYICSELVYECFLRAGRAFVYNENKFISPEEIWRDTKVEFLGRFR